MKPTHYYIRYRLNGDKRAKVFDDKSVYKDMISVNQTLLKKNEDYFAEQ